MDEVGFWGQCTPLVGGAKSWVPWWTGQGPGVAVGSETLKAAGLLVGGAVSLPRQLLGLRHHSIGADRLMVSQVPTLRN